MADVGLLGFPNVGKSTLVRSVTAAKPKVADYPFTTLEPHLGVVTVGAAAGEARTFVIADIPGLVEGASSGTGLGHRFLRHVERTRLLLHLVTVFEEEDRSPVADYDVIRAELAAYSPELAKREEVVAMTKADLPFVREAYETAKIEFEKRGIKLHLVSAATHEGLSELTTLLLSRLAELRKRPELDSDH
jgi:GTP-binding protein